MKNHWDMDRVDLGKLGNKTLPEKLDYKMVNLMEIKVMKIE